MVTEQVEHTGLQAVHMELTGIKLPLQVGTHTPFSTYSAVFTHVMQ